MAHDTNQRFAEKLREAWGRPGLSDGERAAFDARLRGRLQARSPRRVVGFAVGAAAVLAAVAVVLWPTGELEPSAEWLDTLAEARDVGLGAGVASDGLSVYGMDEVEADETLLAAPTWDPEAERLWDSDSVELGHDYEVLAYWLAPANDGDEAGGTIRAP